MYRTFVILRHTFFETILQPIYSLLITLGVLILFIFAALPFFTLGEDTVMYKAVGLDPTIALVLALFPAVWGQFLRLGAALISPRDMPAAFGRRTQLTWDSSAWSATALRWMQRLLPTSAVLSGPLRARTLSRRAFASLA